MKVDGDVSPIPHNVVRQLLLRVFTKHQLLILSELKQNLHNSTVTSLIKRFSETYDIPSSILRRNINQARKFDLINWISKNREIRKAYKWKLICKILNRCNWRKKQNLKFIESENEMNTVRIRISRVEDIGPLKILQELRHLLIIQKSKGLI